MPVRRNATRIFVELQGGSSSSKSGLTELEIFIEGKEISDRYFLLSVTFSRILRFHVERKPLVLVLNQSEVVLTNQSVRLSESYLGIPPANQLVSRAVGQTNERFSF